MAGYVHLHIGNANSALLFTSEFIVRRLPNVVSYPALTYVWLMGNHYMWFRMNTHLRNKDVSML